jgi:hypothetical protein
VIDAAEKVAYYILLVFCLSPAVPISISWVRQFWKKDKFQPLQLFFLAIVIASFAWSIIGYLLRTPSSESLRKSVVGYPGWLRERNFHREAGWTHLMSLLRWGIES